MWVFDATPLIYLAKVDRLTIVDHLDGSCVIPEAVYTEVVTTGIEQGYPDARRIERSMENERFEIVTVEPSRLRSRLQRNTDLSDVDVAVLAYVDAQNGVAVMDEPYGRDVAFVEGVTTRGSAYFVLKSAKKGALSITEARTVINGMVEEEWYCSTGVYSKIIQRLETRSE